VILDTNALSGFVDGEGAIGEILRQHAQIAIPVIVLGEFRYGIAQSRHRGEYEGWLSAHLGDFEILPITEETASEYAALRLALKRTGRPIPANDAWIAALAIQHSLPVLSRNEHFDAVPNLKRQTW
jgi:tRNA(fMet)-specific endonuclease VapC